jgi:hypothetical protein
MMKQYWFSIQPGLGYGVTAESVTEAEKLLASFGYPRTGEKIINITEDVRLDTLDQNHVVPNCGPLMMRGIWFPLHNI